MKKARVEKKAKHNSRPDSHDKQSTVSARKERKRCAVQMHDDSGITNHSPGAVLQGKRIRLAASLHLGCSNIIIEDERLGALLLS